MTNSSGFYSFIDGELLYAPTAVYFDDGSKIEISEKDTYTYPVNDWEFFLSEDEARISLDLPAMAEAPSTPPGMFKSRAEREEERLQRQADYIARLSRNVSEDGGELPNLQDSSPPFEMPASTRYNRPARYPSEATLAKARLAKGI